MRFGSARISRTDVCCRAWIVAPRLMSGRNRKIFKRLVKLNGMAGLLDPVIVVLVAVLVLVVVLGTVPCMVGGVNCWVEIDPIVFVAPVLKRLIPKVCILERSTSAIFTSNSTWRSCRTGTIREFTTWVE